MKPQARQGDLEVTRDGLKPITQCNSRRTYVNNLRAAAVGDRLVNFTATTGSGRVYIEGRRAHRKMDRNSGGGVCIQGSDTVFVQ